MNDLPKAMQRMVKILQRLVSPVLFFWRYRLLRTGPQKVQGRVLAVWDFSTAPYAIGDVLILSQAASIVRHMESADKVDFCFILDPRKPHRGDFTYINTENYHRHFMQIFPTVFVNQHLGSVLIFDSMEEFRLYLKQNLVRYHFRPSLESLLNGAPGYSSNFNFIQDYFSAYGAFEYIQVRKSSLEWADAFLKERAAGCCPIAVLLRNSRYDNRRNSRIDAWAGFFAYCQQYQPDYRFIIIGSKEEVSEKISCFSNTLYAKSFDTDIEQDLALIQSSAAYFGACSGPAAMAMFSERPYRILNYSSANEKLRKGENVRFAGLNQKLVWEVETEAVLIREFQDMIHGPGFSGMGSGKEGTRT